MVTTACPQCGRQKVVDEAGATAFLTCASCAMRFRPRKRPGQGLGTTLLVVLATALAVPVVVAIIGIVAAIAIPNFIKFNTRAKQGECKANLKSMAVEQR